MANPADSKRISVHFPEEMPTAYATNLVVQHTKHEFFISFFAIAPPLIVGTDDEKRARVEQIEQVTAQPLVKVVVSASRMPEFIKVLQDNYKTYSEVAAKQTESEE